MKILYVEDNDDNIYMLKNRLSRAGFTVLIATSGAQGIAMATSDKPDLILMDITLPDIDGEEATRRIKADPATKGIPIIALTANAMSGDREKALAAGCDDFDTKPVEMPRLLEKISAFKPKQTCRGHSSIRRLLTGPRAQFRTIQVCPRTYRPPCCSLPVRQTALKGPSVSETDHSIVVSSSRRPRRGYSREARSSPASFAGGREHGRTIPLAGMGIDPETV
jgi:two-component system cell cycle response regulator DivK